ncbi:MAG: DUF21 domain-containing protein [Chlamydiae bacterium]|nr:DUF21 domain-containing protein [Chlamydiota bacterium]MBI3276407.1 DUF21 domain-containing protein [Chlamydiota bacterium]
MALDLIFKCISLIFLLVLSAFFSGAETGLFSLSSVRVHRLKEEKKKGVFLIEQLLHDPQKVLATLLLSNLFVVVFSTALAEEIASTLWGSRGLEICILVMSLVVLIFCEIIPKVIAVSRSEKVSLQVAPALKLVMFLIAPLRKLFLGIAVFFIRPILKKNHPIKESITESITPEQLKTATEMGHQEGILSIEESHMLDGILELKKKRASELMTPRSKIFAFEIRTPLLTIYQEILDKKFSRIPIFKGELDEVVGILYAKDLIMKEVVELAAIQIYDFLRNPFFVSDSIKADILLKSFKSRRQHIALCRDEYQKISGLITLDDLTEAIVGKTAREMGQDP